MENKNVTEFLRKELLRPRPELNDNNLSSLGWKKGMYFEDKFTIAECSYPNKTISFSSYWFSNPSKALIKEVILHEIAHAIDDTINEPDKYNLPPHNKKWRSIAKMLGCTYGAKIPVKKLFFGKSILL